MTETIRETDTEADTAAAVLGFVRDRRAVADRAEADLLQAAVSWVAMHSVDSIDQAATVWDRTYGDTGITVAGPGAPLVAEFSVAEFGAAVGLSTEAAKAYLGEAVELRYRLPKVWVRVCSGELPAWKARRIARATILLSPEAAAFVDRHVAPIAHRVRLSQLDRLVAEAIDRFMPEEAERRRKQAADGRSFTIATSQTTLEGTADVWGTLDVADALDLDAAVTAGADALKRLGSAESLDVRRAQAVGALARRQLAFDLNAGDADEAGDRLSHRSARQHKPRQVVLYVHLSDAAIRGESGGFGRCENTRTPVTAEQIRDWCANPDAEVVVKPVIDLNAHHHVEAYEVPDRIAEQSTLINHACVFPWCARSARACDSDHIQPHDRGGPTCSENIAPLCRQHHRLKTHGGWRYTPIERGTYLWTSPHGYSYLRDRCGTLDISSDHNPDDGNDATTHRRRRP